MNDKLPPVTLQHAMPVTLAAEIAPQSPKCCSRGIGVCKTCHFYGVRRASGSVDIHGNVHVENVPTNVGYDLIEKLKADKRRFGENTKYGNSISSGFCIDRLLAVYFLVMSGNV